VQSVVHCVVDCVVHCVNAHFATGWGSTTNLTRKRVKVMIQFGRVTPRYFYVAVLCNVLSCSVLQCVAVCCSVLQCDAIFRAQRYDVIQTQ